jgi:hypothetical protein
MPSSVSLKRQVSGVGGCEVSRYRRSDPTREGSSQKQIADTSVKLGRSARFQVVASGHPPLQYQSRRNGNNIPGAKKPGYKTPPTTSQDNGATFSVIVGDDLGSVTSRDAILTLR